MFKVFPEEFADRGRSARICTCLSNAFFPPGVTSLARRSTLPRRSLTSFLVSEVVCEDTGTTLPPDMRRLSVTCGVAVRRISSVVVPSDDESVDTGYGLNRLIACDFTADPAIDPSRRQVISTVFTAESEGLIGLRTIPEERRSLVPLEQQPRRNFTEIDFVSLSDSSPVSSSSTSVLSTDDADTSESSLSEIEESHSEKVTLVDNEKLELRIVPVIAMLARLYEAHLLMG